MRKRTYLTNRVFGKLKVVGQASDYISPGGQTHARSICLCECGRKVFVTNYNIKSGKQKSCGCVPKMKHAIRGKHGHSNSLIYAAWTAMIQRCRNPRNECYYRYGGRGIKICKRWLSFKNFLQDMGERPDGMTLDRKNNDGDYKPSNCRWATNKTQNRNSRGCVILTVLGITGCISELAEHFKIKRSAVGGRLHLGWAPEEAFTTPVKSRAGKSPARE